MSKSGQVSSLKASPFGCQVKWSAVYGRFGVWDRRASHIFRAPYEHGHEFLGLCFADKVSLLCNQLLFRGEFQNQKQADFDNPFWGFLLDPAPTHQQWRFALSRLVPDVWWQAKMWCLQWQPVWG